MDARALRALQHFYGYSSFRPAQEVPVTALLENPDVLGIMPTGHYHCVFSVDFLDARSGGYLERARYASGVYE